MFTSQRCVLVCHHFCGKKWCRFLRASLRSHGSLYLVWPPGKGHPPCDYQNNLPEKGRGKGLLRGKDRGFTGTVVDLWVVQEAAPPIPPNPDRVCRVQRERGEMIASYAKLGVGRRQLGWEFGRARAQVVCPAEAGNASVALQPAALSPTELARQRHRVAGMESWRLYRVSEPKVS